VAALVQQLGDKTPATRERAAGELIGLGMAAVPLLHQAANELNDPEVSERARQCLQAIEGNTAVSVSAAAVRCLAVLKPAGAAEALLAYLPIAEDEHVVDDVAFALAEVAQRDGKPDAALVKALADPVPLRRAVAAEVLCRVGGEAERSVVRPLLKDPKSTVRLRAAMALVQFQDAEPIPALIGLLADLPQAQTQAIEDLLVGLAGEWAIAVPKGNDSIARRLRRELWMAWWSATDGPALLEEIKKRTLSDADRDRIQALVQQLGDPVMANRDRAMAELLSLGPSVAPFLRRAVNDREARISEPAQKCLQLLDASSYPPLPAVAARLLALRKPAGGAEAILAYLPGAEDENIASLLSVALAALAVREGKPDPAVLKSLQDKVPERRAAAAIALCSAAPDQRPAVRKLLQDPDPLVRLRVALALKAKQDREAIPVLIALLTEIPQEKAEEVEENLRLVAGETAPEVVAGNDDASRTKCRAAWETWWKKTGERVDLTRLDSRQQMLGYTVVVEQQAMIPRRQGRVVELDRRGKIRWQIEGLMGPIDAQVLPGDRVLICEQNLNRVSERDLKGKVLWEQQFNQPVSAQRLPSGNTFLVGRAQIIEVNRTGKETFTHNRPQGDIICGKKQRNGQITFVTNQGLCVRLDPKGKELKTTQVPPIQIHNGYVDMLANEHVLVPLFGQNKVAEFDAEGKNVWEAGITLPISSRRLPNGNALVATNNPPRVVELDRSGRVVWENKDLVRPVRVDRR
jgi:HEAT repeat protein